MKVSTQMKLKEFLAESYGKPFEVSINEVFPSEAFGVLDSEKEAMKQYSSETKTQNMVKKIKAGQKLPPVQVVPLTDNMRKKNILFKNASKKYKWAITDGNHRYIASKIAGLKTITAKQDFGVTHKAWK